MKRVSHPVVAPVAAAFVVLGTILFFYWTAAYRFVLSNDEGIFLDGARRILNGQAPYRDFFILMGPGSFWLQALAIKIFGMTLAASRAVTLLDYGVIAGCVFWLVARRSSPALGAFTAAVCLILETADPVVALPNHRWDSAALAMLAVTIVASEASPALLFLAGACAAFAAWVTPTVGLVGLALGLYLLWLRRADGIRFAVGGIGISAVSTAVLAAQGALLPLIQQMLWTGSNYSRANRMPYGSRFGGYGQLFAGSEGGELVVRALIVFGLTLPAILPPVVAIVAWLRRREAANLIVVIGAFALLASAYPRFDVPHLTYAAPLFYALLAPEFARFSSNKARVAAFLGTCLLTTLFGGYAVLLRFSETPILSQVGNIRASAEDRALITGLQQRVPRGSTLFVYPYLPVAYFLTLTENPTRYSYLQPGMMSDHDEQTALAELEAAPPERVLFFDLPEAQILHFWPGSDQNRLRMRQIEAFLAQHYRPASEIKYGSTVFRVLERMSTLAATRSLPATPSPEPAQPSRPGR